MNQSGFWQTIGDAANIDWCEPNYTFTFYVAEWFNTISSLPILIMAVAGLYFLKKKYHYVLPRFYVGFLGMALVGLGSALFHATLLRYPQASDELPMIYLGTTMLYLIKFRGREGRNLEDFVSMRLWALGLGLYLLLFTIAYFAFQAYFIFFIATYIGIVAYIVIRSAYICYKLHPSRQLQQLYWLPVTFYVGGVFFFWAPSQFFLPCDHWFQVIEPHAIFHLTSSVGTYTYLLFAFKDHQITKSEKTP